MPKYSLICEDCGNKYKENRSIVSTLEFKCPKCGSLNWRQEYNNGNFILKGDDYVGKIEK